MRYVVFVTQPNGEVVELTFDELADAEGYADTRQLSVQSMPKRLTRSLSWSSTALSDNGQLGSREKRRLPAALTFYQSLASSARLYFLRRRYRAAIR